MGISIIRPEKAPGRFRTSGNALYRSKIKGIVTVKAGNSLALTSYASKGNFIEKFQDPDAGCTPSLLSFVGPQRGTDLCAFANARRRIAGNVSNSSRYAA